MHLFTLTDKKFKMGILCVFVGLVFFGVGCATFQIGSHEKDKTEEEMFILMEKGNSYNNKGQYDQAKHAYEEAIRRKPEPKDISISQTRPWAQNNLAWLLATCPDDTVRNGEKAVLLAEELLIHMPSNAAYLDTLAAAYAEVGRFDDAVKIEQKALSIIPKGHACSNGFQSRLNTYMSKNPWRETGKVVKVHKDLTWSISIADFDKLDSDRDGSLRPVELVPSFQDLISPILRESAESQIPPEIAAREDWQKVMKQAVDELAEHLAKQAQAQIDSDLNGYLSQEEVAAIQSNPLPVNLDFELSLK